jgi:uncharacterized RDD family membrane protein YckC
MNPQINELPEGVILAPLGKRIGSALIDLVIFFTLMYGLYYLVGVPAILNNNSYYPTIEAENSYVRATGLLSEDKDGRFVYYVYEDTDASRAKGEYAYQKYVDHVWHYFMEVIPANKANYSTEVVFRLSLSGNLCTTFTKTPDAKDQEYGRWVYENFFGYVQDDISCPFVPKVENDFTSVPVTQKDPAKDYATLRRVMFDSSNYTGHYVDACVHLDEQPAFAKYRTEINNAVYYARVPAMMTANLLLFFLLPMVLPKGKTLGKLILGLGLIRQNGDPATRLNVFLRQIVIVLIYGAMALPWSALVVPVFGLLLIVDFLFMFMSRQHTGFHDLLGSTLVVDTRVMAAYNKIEAE